MRRRFHDFREYTAHVLRVYKEDERAVRADARLAEHARALRLELGPGGLDVGHLEADMMLPAEGVLLEELHDRRVRPERLDQLDLAVGRVDEADADALRGKVEGGPVRLGAEHRAVHGQAVLDRWRREPDMVQSAQLHPLSPSFPRKRESRCLRTKKGRWTPDQVRGD